MTEKNLEGPGISALRNWDHRILERYPPAYAPTGDACDWCTYGKCDLGDGKEGACGIDLEAGTAREAMVRCVMGAACHTAQGRLLLNRLIGKYGSAHPMWVEATLTETIMGMRPKTVGDFATVLEYVEEQLTHLIASASTGQEGSSLDFESKTLHAGMLDLLGMEVTDMMMQASFVGPEKSVKEMAEIGMGILDCEKPVVICVGHNISAPAYILDYMKSNGLSGRIEMGGLCCTAHEMSRYSGSARIIGPMSKELKYIRSGIPDVLVTDEQCVRADVLREAKKLRIPVIATNEKAMYGLPDRSRDCTDAIIDDLVSGSHAGAVVLEPEKVGELVPRLAMKIAPVRKAVGLTALPNDAEFGELVARCTKCLRCTRDCPAGLPIADAMTAAAAGDLSKFEELHDKCVGCGKCDYSCAVGIPVLNVIEKASQRAIREEMGRVRIVRGRISDHEIREEGRELIGLGRTPGVLAFVGCGNYPDGTGDICEVVEEMLGRGYVVLTSGCAAMDIGMQKDRDGKTLYERHEGRFAKGGLLNTGSCVSNARMAAAVIRMAAAFSGMEAKGNWENLADYILKNVGMVVIAWGASSQKVFATATGCNRLGIPVVMGPHGAKYGRTLDGNACANNVPERLMTTAGTKEELMPLIAKLCFRPGDSHQGRSVKLENYIGLGEKFLGKMPDDWRAYVRSESDLPAAGKERLMKLLPEKRHI